MPELPEVESVRRGVEDWAAGATITRAEVIDPRILGTTSQRRVAPDAVADFVDTVTGHRIRAAERRGKFMWLTLGADAADTPGDSRSSDGASHLEGAGLSLIVHLGMSGQLRVHSALEHRHRHTRALFELERAGETYEMRFVDQRIFGHLGVQPLTWSQGRWVPASAAHIGADPLEDAFDADAVIAQLARKRTVIKSALLDQTLVSGIGNIYADEALFRAGVHPLAVPARTRRARLAAVLDSAGRVMADALAVGGTSFDALYVNVNGESGYFDRALLAYGRAGQECVRCGTEISRLVIGGRSSHFCARCQPPPRYR